MLITDIFSKLYRDTECLLLDTRLDYYLQYNDIFVRFLHPLARFERTA